MIEPAAGSPVRQLGLFDYLAGGKQSVVPADDADFAVVAGGRRHRLTDGTSPWHAAATDGRPDRVVLIDLSPFGRSGPYAEWTIERPRHVGDGRLPLLHRVARPRADLAARSARPVPRRRPRRASPRSSGVHERERSGHGQAVEISELDATLTAHAWLVSSWAANGALLARGAAGPHQGQGRLGLRDAHRPEGRAVRDDRAARPRWSEASPSTSRRGTRTIPRIFEAVAGVGVRQDGRRDRRARAAAAGRRHAGRRRWRRARRRAARRPRLVGARGRRRPSPASRTSSRPARRRGAARRRPSAPSPARRRPAAAEVDASRRAAYDRVGRPARRASASSRSRRTGPARSPAASSPTSARTTSRSSGPPGRRPGP